MGHCATAADDANVSRTAMYWLLWRRIVGQTYRWDQLVASRCQEGAELESAAETDRFSEEECDRSPIRARLEGKHVARGPEAPHA